MVLPPLHSMNRCHCHPICTFQVIPMVPPCSRRRRKQRSNHTVSLRPATCPDCRRQLAVSCDGCPAQLQDCLPERHGQGLLHADVNGVGHPAVLEYRRSGRECKLWKVLHGFSSSDMILHFLIGGILMVFCLAILATILSIGH